MTPTSRVTASSTVSLGDIPGSIGFPIPIDTAASWTIQAQAGLVYFMCDNDLRVSLHRLS